MDIHQLEADLDLKQDFTVDIKCKQYDDLILKFGIYSYGDYVDLSQYTIEMNILKPDNTIYIQNSSITYEGNYVTLECTPKLTVVGGVANGEILLVDKSTHKKKYSFNVRLKIVESTIVDGITSESTLTLLDEIQDALDQLRYISVNLNQAIQVNKEMVDNISTGTELNNNLITNTEIADILNEDLKLNTITGNETNDKLEDTIKIGQTLNNTLEGNITHGDKTNIDLVNNIKEGNELYIQSSDLHNKLEDSIVDGKQTIEDLKDANKDFSQHINNTKIHLTEDEKVKLLLMFDNWDIIMEQLDKIIGTGYLVDEDDNVFVDEEGNFLIV